MAVRVTAIHVLAFAQKKTWMPATSAGMASLGSDCGGAAQTISRNRTAVRLCCARHAAKGAHGRSGALNQIAGSRDPPRGSSVDGSAARPQEMVEGDGAEGGGGGAAPGGGAQG